MASAGEGDAVPASGAATTTAAKPAPARDKEIGARLHRSGYSEENVDGPAYLNTPWIKPDVLRAREKYRNTLFDHGEAPLYRTTIDHMSQLGVGITLHLRLVKYYMCFFIMASLIAIPVFSLCYFGDQLSDDEMDPLRMARISIANVGNNATIAPWLFAPTVKYSPRESSAIIMACDFAIVWLFLLFILFMSGRIKSVTAEVDANVITASDYAIYVQGLPKNATEDEIREHFSKLYNLREPDWTYPSRWSRCFLGRKMTRRHQFKPPNKTAKDDKRRAKLLYRELRDEDVYPVLDARNSGNAAYLKSWVAEVSVANANGSLIKRFQDQTGLWLRIRNARALAKKYYKDSPFADAAKFKRAEEKVTALTAKFEAIKSQAVKLDSADCVGAFVLFQNEESVRRCLEDYHGSDSWFDLGAYWFQPPMLRFRGTDRLAVTKAPDPSQIVWQNLELTSCQRFMRQTAVNLLLVALLVLSFLLIILAQSQQTKFRSKIPDLQLCNTVLPAIAFDRHITTAKTLAYGDTLPAGLSMRHDASDPQCSPLNLPRLYWYSTTGAQRATAPLAADPCLNECVDADATCRYAAVDGNVTFSLNSAIACFCVRTLSSAVESKGLFTGASSVATTEYELCGQVAADYVIYNAFVLVASAIVVIINVFLRVILSYITTLEGHPSVSAMQKAVATKVFLSLFLNTALLVLLINAALPSTAQDVSIGGNQVFGGKYSGFDAKWQASIGGGIVLTLLINIVTPHMFNIWYLACFLPCRRLHLQESAVTQMQLEKKYTPPEFEMPTRTAVLMNTLFSTCVKRVHSRLAV